MTAGAGSVWALNQGDGTVTRSDRTFKVKPSTIALGIPGQGGDIHYGQGFIWASSFGFPLTAVSAQTGTVIRQWAGKGGDSLGLSPNSIWLTDYHAGTISRISLRGLRLTR